MNIEWNKIRTDRERDEQDRIRREAQDIVATALQAVADMIERRTGSSDAPLLSGDVVGALYDVAKEINKP